MPHGVPVAHLEGADEYFRRLDAELIEEARKHDAAREEHRLLGEAAGVEDSAIIEELERLGYTAETVRLLPLAPLVELAWADGSINPVERKLICARAGEMGIAENTEAYAQLTAWLARRPPPEFFLGTWRALRARLAALPAGERHAEGEAIARRCRDFANSSCAHFGWSSRICAVKQKLLDQIAGHLSG